MLKSGPVVRQARFSAVFEIFPIRTRPAAERWRLEDTYWKEDRRAKNRRRPKNGQKKARAGCCPGIPSGLPAADFLLLVSKNQIINILILILHDNSFLTDVIIIAQLAEKSKIIYRG